MTRNFIIYAVFIVVGLGVAAWYISRLGSSVDTRFEAAKHSPKKIKANPKNSAPVDYDRKGRIAALRIQPKDQSTNPNSRPLFWLKGNLVIVEKDNWGNSDLKYSKRTVPREELEAIMNSFMAMPKLAETDVTALRCIFRPKSGDDIVLYASPDSIKQVIKDSLSERPKKPFTIQALEITGTLAQKNPTTEKWPIAAISLAKLLREKTMLIRSKREIRAIQDSLSLQKTCQSDDIVAEVSVQVHVDR